MTGHIETFADHPDPEVVDAAAKRFGIARRLRRVLPWVEPVRAGNHLEHARVVSHSGGHRTYMVECQLDRHDAGVWHEAVGRLQTDDAAQRCGNAN